MLCTKFKLHSFHSAVTSPQSIAAQIIYGHVPVILGQMHFTLELLASAVQTDGQSDISNNQHHPIHVDITQFN